MINFDATREYSGPVPFWYWNGDLREEKLLEQMAEIRAKGIYEFFIHARKGLEIEFLSEAWFDRVELVLTDARRHGMKIWIYDELNWPSGMAGGKVTAHPEFVEHYLTDSNEVKITRTILPSKTEYQEEEAAAITKESCPDYLNKASAETFIELAYQPYFERFENDFGSTIQGFFSDEIRFANARPWSHALGEDIPKGADYFKKLGAAISENYFATIANWCEERHVEFIGHVMGEETLGSQVRYVSSIFNVLGQFHRPGVDHLGPCAEGSHPRIAASISHMSENPKVTCETFGGCSWDMTPQDLFRISGWLFASGITQIILHGFSYEEQRDDWPPNLFVDWKHWNEMGEYVEWCGRVQHFLAKATPVCRVGLYYPYEEFLEDYKPDTRFTLNFTDGARIQGKTANKLHLSMQELGAELLKAGIDYDIVPRQYLDKFEGDILVAPSATRPDFNGTVIGQGEQSAAECIARVDKKLGQRPRLIGENTAPSPQPASEYISDPYFHNHGDDAGVLLKEFILDGQSAFLVWNANEHEFDGALLLGETKEFHSYDPIQNQWAKSRGQELTIHLQPYSMKIIVEKTDGNRSLRCPCCRPAGVE